MASPSWTKLSTEEALARAIALMPLLRRDLGDVMDTAMAGNEITTDQRIRCCRDHGYAAKVACDAVDVSATAAHLGTNWDIAGSTFGSMAPGNPPTELWG